jgi:preprotein translocase subunit SecA
MSPSLSVVANNDLNVPKVETVAERVRKLQSEARQLAKDHIHALTTAISEAERMAVEIADGGEAYPAGVRDLARRFAEDAGTRVQTLEAITART